MIVNVKSRVYFYPNLTISTQIQRLPESKQVSHPMMHHSLRDRPPNTANTPAWSVTRNSHGTLRLQRANRIRKLAPVNLDTALLAEETVDISPAGSAITGAAQLVDALQDTALEILPLTAVTSTRTLSEQAHIDKTSTGVGGCLFDGGADEPDGFFHVVSSDLMGQPHACVCLGQPDHGFQLTGCRGDAPLLRPDVVAKFAHGNVGIREGSPRGRSENWVDLGFGVGDVCRQEFHRLRCQLVQQSVRNAYQDLLRARVIRSILQVHVYQMLGQPAILLLVHSVQHQVD